MLPVLRGAGVLAGPASRRFMSTANGGAGNPLKALALPRHANARLARVAVAEGGSGVSVGFRGEADTNGESAFDAVWLLDNCPSRVDAHSYQKKNGAGSLSRVIDDAQIKAATLLDDASMEVEWRNGHRSVYPSAFLRSYAYDARRLEEKQRALNEVVGWGRDDGVYETTYAELVESDTCLLRVLRTLSTHGLVFVRNVPTHADASIPLINRLGALRETFYGRLWDVVSVPRATNIAYTSSYLGLHQDLLYFEAPPGLQLLHCTKNSVVGGDALFVDGFAAMRDFQAAYPEHFQTLSTTPVVFHYRAAGHHRRYVHRTFERDGDNEAMRLFYAPPFQGPLEAPADRVMPYYRAMAKFEEMLSEPSRMYSTHYQPGDLAIFANRRILHGRNAFESAQGERHLRGSYVDADEWRNTLRILDARNPHVLGGLTTKRSA